MIELPEQRIERIIDELIHIEGGDEYTNDPLDRGGETRYGVTVAVARAYGYTGPMRDMPESVARAIFRKKYIEDYRFNDVFAVDPNVGLKIIDMGVNMGQGHAAMQLQRWLNGFNDQDKHYAALKVDGRIGPATLDALRAFVRWRGPMGITALLRGLNGTQATRYLDITENNKTQRKYLFGWVSNRVQ